WRFTIGADVSSGTIVQIANIAIVCPEPVCRVFRSFGAGNRGSSEGETPSPPPIFGKMCLSHRAGCHWRIETARIRKSIANRHQRSPKLKSISPMAASDYQSKKVGRQSRAAIPKVKKFFA